MLCSKLQILSSLILYSGLQIEEAAGKSYIVATKKKKEVERSEELHQESENPIGNSHWKFPFDFPSETLDEMHFLSVNALPEVANIGSPPEIKRDCDCGKRLINVKRESFHKEEERLMNEISGGEIAVAHEFPWAVRIFGGCAQGLCGGALVSPRIILSAYHCGVALGSTSTTLCDHSDGRRLAIIGLHNINKRELRHSHAIPIIKVESPPNGWLTWGEHNSHDFALFILERAVTFTDTISPICLPEPNLEFGGEKAIAAGWGRFHKPNISGEQSAVLRKVWLTVSKKRYRHKKMFGTNVTLKDDHYQDPCSGDSGGPLMYFNNASDTFTIIGTVNGNGYDCRTDKVYWFEGSNNGLWNKVSAHMDWILKTMEKWGQKVCYDDSLSNKSLKS